MKKVLKYIVGVALLPLALAGCTSNFDEYNTNPYEPTTLDVRQFFAEMQDCFASPEENPYQRNATFWACFGGYITAPHSWSRSTLYSTWNIDDDWNKWTVDWYYTKFYPSYFQVENYTEKQGQYYALAVLHRVAVMQYVLNLQGPLPYSQVTNGKYAVPYDDEKTAWHKMFDDLDFAIAELSNAIDPNYRPMSGYDRVYNGDYEKWVKFANSLKLRMAIRISGVDAEYAKQQALSAINHPIGVMTSNSDSAYDNLNGRFPNGFYQVGTGWGEARLNASITAYMNGYEDPRREKLFTEATVADTSGYIGVRSGIAGANKADFAEYSQWNVTSTTPIPFFVAAEVAFLRAEGCWAGTWAARHSTGMRRVSVWPSPRWEPRVPRTTSPTARPSRATTSTRRTAPTTTITAVRYPLPGAPFRPTRSTSSRLSPRSGLPTSPTDSKGGATSVARVIPTSSRPTTTSRRRA